MAKSKAAAPKPAPPSNGEYTVVARRYRPKQFAELIGQEHVARALTNALQSGRIAHAYLFTGARGTGKTSAARILAKALNCAEGPTATPCDKCERCLAIAEGQEVDVVEMDAASNRGIEESRGIRQNVGFMPVHSRFKVYIVDEVHMMTVPAFNALLKTLEEPPAHVKFILATTDVRSLPITILSRCQRFDFAHVSQVNIFGQLKSIVEREGLEADEDALRLIARRANGSMRDSQSLLDQLLASSSGRLSTEHVQAVLGCAGDERVGDLAAAILEHDATKALNLLTEATERGLQLGELTDQLIDYWRSLMLVACGGPDVEDLPVTPSQKERVLEQAKRTSLDTVLAGLDVLTTAKARMRGSPHLPVLLEMAVVRLARLEEMLSVGELLKSGAAPVATRPAAAPEVKKNGTPRPPEVNGNVESATLQAADLTEATVSQIWGRLLQHFESQSPVLANNLKRANLPAIFGPNSLAIRFPRRYSHAYDFCATEPNAGRVQEAVRQVAGPEAAVRFELTADGPEAANEPSTPQPSAGGRRKEIMALPLFSYAEQKYGAKLTRADDDFNPAAVSAAAPAIAADDDEPPIADTADED